LSWEEHNRVVDITIHEVKGRVQVISGAGSNNTHEAIEAAIHAQEIGSDAILCITPYYNKPTQEGLYQHFHAIADRITIPMVLYNVPSRTGVNLLPQTLERLCEFKPIVAIKEASGNLQQVSEMHRRCGNRITILSGDDGLTLPMLACGGKGVISVVGNILPAKMSEMVRAFLEKRVDEALALHEELLPVCDAMFIETNPIPVKTAMNYLGLYAGTFRLPLVPMSENNKERLISVLQSSNVQSVNIKG
jgi:4-hydroxy-tetrahydrodipicolinate synthase